jgi:hypothetical protein
MGSKTEDSLRVARYVGDAAILLAFDLDENTIDKLAGFAIKCKTPNRGPYPSNEYFLPNKVNLQEPITKEKESGPIQTGSDKAPFQMFHWIHFPSAGPGSYQYTIYASYFKDDGSIELGPNVSVDVDLSYHAFPGLEVGLTRGYVSSQAYVDRFHNQPIRPAKKAIDFDTQPYLAQYQWLGAHARKVVFEFLEECKADPSIFVDVFAFDLDEVDIIRALCKMGPRVRVFQDNSESHVKATAIEPKAVDALRAAGVNVKEGHFNRFAHNKVMIQKKEGEAVKVLTGSANFSIRGLYVQANSVLVFDNADVASLYEQAFEQAFTNEDEFKKSTISSQWYDVKKSGTPQLSVSFAPHRTPFSLDKVARAIDSATSSVLFAVMEMGGKGSVMTALQNLGLRQNLFSLGTIQSEGDLTLFKPGIDSKSAVTSFDFLEKNVPEPFKKEWRGGAGQVIHHKFVACDFNGESPVVFCGSSNLSQGGETSNGDNLIAICDQKVATIFAVEAIRLYDHYRFRSLHEHSTSNKPLVLSSTDAWVKPYYDPKNIKFHERLVFAGAEEK